MHSDLLSSLNNEQMSSPQSKKLLNRGNLRQFDNGNDRGRYRCFEERSRLKPLLKLN